MRIVRYRTKGLQDAAYGVLEGEKIVPIEGTPYDGISKRARANPIDHDECTLLSPCEPTKVIALALNFAGIDGQEANMTEPLVFLKGSNAVVGPGDMVELPFELNTWGEVEIAAVIRKRAKRVTPDTVEEYVLGYTTANDVSCDNVDGRDHHLLRSKAADGFCPCGPYIDTEFDLANKEMSAYHNGELVRQGNTSTMVWDFRRAISWLSSWVTLCPGDLVLSGTPPYVKEPTYLGDGDEFRAEVEGLSPLVTRFYRM